MTLGTNVSGGDTVFYDGIRAYNLGQQAHVFKHFNRICIAGLFETVLHKCTLWRGIKAVILFILHKTGFLLFYQHVDVFYNRYIKR